MFLQQKVRHFFPLTIQARGKDYFLEKRVKVYDFSHGIATFEVTGTDLYFCTFDWSQVEKTKNIKTSCSCPYFKEGNNCKHLWASILYADRYSVWDGPMFPRSVNISRSKMIYEGSHEILNSNPLAGHEFQPNQFTGWLRAFNQVKPAKSKIKNQNKKNLKAFYGLVLDSQVEDHIPINLYYKEISNGERESNLLKSRLTIDNIEDFYDPQDRELLTLIFAIHEESNNYWNYERQPTQVNIPHGLQKMLLAKMVQTNRLFVDQGFNTGITDSNTLSIIESTFQLSIQITEHLNGYKVHGQLQNEENIWQANQIPLITQDGVFVSSQHLGSFNPDDYYWLTLLKKLSSENIPIEDGDLLVKAIYSRTNVPKIKWPKSLAWKKLTVKPLPKLLISHKELGGHRTSFFAEIRFLYGEDEVSSLSSHQYIVNTENKTLYSRDLHTENECLKKIAFNGASAPPDSLKDKFNFRIRKDDFLAFVNQALKLNWLVEAYGSSIEAPNNFDLSVSSGIDWFEVATNFTFKSGFSLSLPALLDAIKKGENLIPLGKGRLAMIPEEWLEKYGGLIDLGETKGEALRFTKAHGVFLDAYLNDDENVTFDLDFRKFQKKLKSFKMQKTSDPSPIFNGELREYQKVGLAWLEYLNNFEIGGILADDMGLGKTVQILAHLQKEILKTKKGEKPKPNLIVVPKSLVYNWKNEAEKFTPNLRVSTYVGNERFGGREVFSENDLIITTFHTLRIDQQIFSEIEFNYLILDEAQVIKNPKSQISKACKQVPSMHKLALTGTPIENSISDLFSIMDFTNPGLISSKLKNQFNKSLNQNNNETKKLLPLSKALSPMILRRTKLEVLKDLPPKSVNTLKCELSEREMKTYNELKNYYQTNLSKKFANKGLNNSKIDILEALLRLRQAACHPGLLNKNELSRSSAKLETLLEQIKEVMEGGHKCLVFSQFTSFLKIVEDKLNREKIKYCYLDGKTTKRQQIVNAFQESKELKVFLISLKAGGLGLNLTSADYVFILDPWWNPAAEMQAIDRTHRIGQKNRVMAYKLISKDTVEEKILQLQESKKGLSDAIINSDTSVLKKLTLDEINFLLA